MCCFSLAAPNNGVRKSLPSDIYCFQFAKCCLKIYVTFNRMLSLVKNKAVIHRE